MGVNPVSICKSTVFTASAGIVSSGFKTFVHKETVPTVNILSFFKKGLHDYEQINGILSRLPEEEKLLGNLPTMWRKMFKPSELSQKTAEIHNIFYDFAKKFQKADGYHSKVELTLQNLTKTLRDIFKCNTEVSYIDAGMFKSAIRIKCGQEDLALQVFHNKVPETVEPFPAVCKRHGQTMEIQNAIALTHGLKPSQRARFYMGRITSIGEEGGYMLCEYVHPQKLSGMSIQPYSPRDDFTYSRFLMNDALKRGNVIDGKLVDFGDIEYRFQNKEQEKIAQEIFPLICKGDTKTLVAIKENYKGNLDFDEVVKRSTAEIKFHLSYPFNLISYMEKKGAKEVLSSLNVLGVDFPELKTYRYFKPEQINFLRSVGIIQ